MSSVHITVTVVAVTVVVVTSPATRTLAIVVVSVVVLSVVVVTTLVVVLVVVNLLLHCADDIVLQFNVFDVDTLKVDFGRLQDLSLGAVVTVAVLADISQRDIHPIIHIGQLSLNNLAALELYAYMLTLCVGQQI